MSKHKKFSTRRIVIDALLISLFFVLSLFSVEIGGVKITFVSLPTVVCAMLYDPVDACIVGFLGAFLEQMMKYGFTATTLLWLVPAAIRGLVIGLGVVLFRKQMINNPFGLLAFFAGMILINAVLLVPPLKSLFSIASLTGLQYAWIHIFSFGSMILIQIVKFVKSMVQRSAS